MTELGNVAGFPILSLITFLPAAGALFIIFFLKREWTGAIRWTALGVSMAEFAMSLYLPCTYDASTHAFQWVEKAPWFERYGMHYFLGADGISLLLVLLTTFITIICILASWTDIKAKVKGYMALLLLVETGSLGVFLSLDLFLFYVFWEAVLIPMVFIIGIWGGTRRIYASVKFFIFTFAGSLFMLLGIMALYFYHGHMTGVYTFDATVLFENPLPAAIQYWIFIAFFLGFAVKVPMFPVHTWLPDAHTEAPTAGSIVLAAVLLKLGTYGFVRFSLPLLPNASMASMPFIMGISLFAIVYGAFVTIAQKDMKKLVAYSSVSHMGFVMIGMFAFNAEGLKGSVLQMINHGISTGALFLMVGMIYERTHTRMIGDYSGLFKTLPVYGTFFLITILSSMGLPATNGFIGELFVIIGVFKTNPLYVIPVVVGVLLGAVYLLRLFQRVFLGEFVYHGHGQLRDLNWREAVSALSLVALIFWIGLRPGPVLRVMDASIDHLVKQIDTNSRKAALPGKERMASSCEAGPDGPSGGHDGTSPGRVGAAPAAHATAMGQASGSGK